MAMSASGVALTRSSCSAQGSLQRLKHIDVEGRDGRAPHQPDDEAGDEERGDEGGNRRKRAHRRARRGRGASAQTAWTPPEACATPSISRPTASLVHSPMGLERAQMPLVDHRHPVGHLEQLVEVLADDHDGAALPGEIDERLPDEPGRAGIDAPGRLVDDDQLRLADDLAADRRISAGCRRRVFAPAGRLRACARRSSGRSSGRAAWPR